VHLRPQIICSRPVSAPHLTKPSLCSRIAHALNFIPRQHTSEHKPQSQHSPADTKPPPPPPHTPQTPPPPHPPNQRSCKEAFILLPLRPWECPLDSSARAKNVEGPPSQSGRIASDAFHYHMKRKRSKRPQGTGWLQLDQSTDRGMISNEDRPRRSHMVVLVSSNSRLNLYRRKRTGMVPGVRSFEVHRVAPVVNDGRVRRRSRAVIFSIKSTRATTRCAEHDR